MPGQNRKRNGQAGAITEEDIDDRDTREYLNAVFRGRNDPVWFANNIIAVTFEPYHKPQEALLRWFYQSLYDPSALTYNKLVLLAGQRGGKTALVSIMGLFELFLLYTLPKTPWEHYGLMRGQNVMISVLSTGKEQAEDSIWGNMTTMFEESEWFATWTDLKSYTETIESKKKSIVARILSSSSSTGAGRTNKFVGVDEIDLYDDTAGKRGAWLIHDKMWNSCQTLGDDGHMALISSSNDNPASIMNTLYARAVAPTPEGGVSEPQTLALIKPTWELNTHPALAQAVLLEKYKNNLQAYYRDFACQPGMYSGMEFPDGVKLCKDIDNVLQSFKLLNPRTQHVMAIDPSATNDSFGMATAYKAPNGRTIVDGVLKYTKNAKDPFINPDDIDEIMLKAFGPLNVYAFVHDTWMYPHLVKKALDMGIHTEKHIVKKEDYDRWKSMQTDGVLDVIYDVNLQVEANQLRVVNDTKVDHPLKGSKDVADCVANCIWFLDGQEPPEKTKPAIPLIYRIRRA